MLKLFGQIVNIYFNVLTQKSEIFHFYAQSLYIYTLFFSVFPSQIDESDTMTYNISYM